jgi:hypothetical protein
VRELLKWARLEWLVKPVALGWAVLMGTVAVAEAAFDYVPRLNIDAVAFDEKDPLSTLFRVTNIGRLHVSDLRFRCEIKRNVGGVITLENVIGHNGDEAAVGNGSVKRLDPDKPTTRDCGTRFIQFPIGDPAAIRIEFTAKYHWPFVGFPDSATRHFSTRRSADGTKLLLVPDIEE